MEKENEFSKAVVESDFQSMMRVFLESQNQANEDRRQANEDRRWAMANAEEDRRLANERFLLSDARIEKAYAELAGQKARIDGVELRVDQLQLNNLNAVERVDEIAGAQKVLKEEMSSGFANAGRDFATLELEVTDRVSVLERKIESGGNAISEERGENLAELQEQREAFDSYALTTNARLDETSQNYEGMRIAVGQLQNDSQTVLAELGKQAAQLQQVQGAFGKILEGVNSLQGLDAPDPVRDRFARTRAAQRDPWPDEQQSSEEGEAAVSSDASESVPPGFAPLTPHAKGPSFRPSAVTASEARREALAATPGGVSFLAAKTPVGGGG